MSKNSTEYNREYYLKNKERIKAYRAEVRKDPEHKAKRKKYHAQYHLNNPYKTRERMRRRRARLKNVEVIKYTEAEVIEAYGAACHLCGKGIDLQAPRWQGTNEGWEMGLHIDHVIPISKGGSDTLENVRPAHAKCNLDKGACLPIQLVIQHKEY